MFRPTRLLSSVRGLTTHVRRRLHVTQHQLPFHLVCVLTGFILGNRFGTFLNVLRRAVPWDGFIIGGCLCVCEYISFQTYRRRTGRSLFASRSSRCDPRSDAPRSDRPDAIDVRIASVTWRPWNLLKLGLLFGFFVDAFKVGS